jgi:serine/threonine-protein kinase SRPK3
MMTALLGPPPPEFLNRSKETSKYWNKDGKRHRQQALKLPCLLILTNLLDLGKWKGPVPLPTEKTLQSLSHTLAKDDKEQFLNFVQCLLRWLPEERLTAGQAYYHPWLRDRS